MTEPENLATPENEMVDRSDEMLEMYAEEDGAQVLDRVASWFGRFIGALDADDLDLLALWAVHTHLALECYTTPRLLLDSITPGSGKTTVCEHLNRLTCNAVHFASLSSTALLVRILQQGICTLLIDEVDRSLAPDKPGVGELTAVMNSGYKAGATRPVLVPAKGGQWAVEKMSTFAPVVLAGNSPRLPDDTRSRCIRILLMPSTDIEDSDWEYIEDDARRLHDNISAWADTVRNTVKEMTVDLPENCTGRAREKWRPLKRVAVAADGHWPATTDRLIRRGLDEDRADLMDGLRSEPPAMILMRDLYAIWNMYWADKPFVATKDLVNQLILHNPQEWGLLSYYGKPLTDTRFGRMVAQATKVRSARVRGDGPRGYVKADLDRAWSRLKIGT
ncbi:MAG: DUF3631 domain-containing protein [Mycolicibacterium rufum]|nr:DUF3631 domain-containing protein [Mycolicibacterium rufum]